MPTSNYKNKGCVPDLQSEGTYLRADDLKKLQLNNIDWSRGLTPFERLFTHQTLSSARKNAHFIPDPELIPQNDLDFILHSVYDHSQWSFTQHGDELFQPATFGIVIQRHSKGTPMQSKETPMQSQFQRRNAISYPGHIKLRIAKDVRQSKARMGNLPITIGGIKERRHPMNIKLMNSSHHSPQTIGGYTRQDRDGTRFCY